MFDRESWISLVPFIVICFAAAGIVSFITNTSVNTWYAQLRKPRWTPPNWIFAPVWTTLSVLMAFSAWLVWRSTEWSVARSPLVLFGIQLALNTLWSLVFFGLREVRLAFVEIPAPGGEPAHDRIADPVMAERDAAAGGRTSRSRRVRRSDRARV